MIDFSISITGAPELMADMSKISPALEKPIANALSGGARRVADRTRANIRGQGIGRAIWGRKPLGLNQSVYGMRVTKSGDYIMTGVKMKGIPVLVEVGGRIASHEIKPRGGRPLASAARNFFSKTAVHHPGMTIGARHFAQSAMSSEVSAIIADVNRQIDIVLQRTFA